MTGPADMLKTVIGKCAALRESGRSIPAVTIVGSIDATSVISSDDGLPSELNPTIHYYGYVSQTSYRAPIEKEFFVNEAGERAFNYVAPPDGFFNLMELGCGCCRCRVIFGTGGFPSTVDEDPGGTFGAPVYLSTDGDLSGDGDPPGDVPDTTLTAQLWPAASAPCRRPDGPPLRPLVPMVLTAFLPLSEFGVGHEWANPDEAPDQPPIDIEIDGNAGAEIGPGSVDTGVSVSAVFTAPLPCSDDQVYRVRIDYSRSYLDAVGILHENSATTIVLVLIGAAGGSNNSGSESGLISGGLATSDGGLVTGGLVTGGLVTNPLETSDGLSTGTITTGTLDTGNLSLGGLSSGDGLNTGSLTTGGLD